MLTIKTAISALTWSMSILLLWSVAIAQPSPWRSSTQAIVSPASTLHDLSQAQIVYLGETHDRAADHQAEQHIIADLYARVPHLAIGMEMFQRPYQALLDQYIAGQLSDAQLRQQSDYDQRWGYDWEYYAPILHFARTHQLPVIALNVPTEITHRVAAGGLEALSAADRQQIPPAAELRLDNSAYRQRLQDLYEHLHQGQSNSIRFDNFFLAQVLWDETMAQTIADYLRTHAEKHVIILAGQGHIIYGDGIPSRVARRLAGMPLQQRSVLLNPEPDDQTQPTIAHYFWIE